VQATYDLPWGTGVGLNYVLESGTPLNTQINEKSVFFFPFGRGDLGRTPTYSRTDLAVQHDVRFWGTRVNVGVNITNLFDQDTVMNRIVTPYRDALNLSNEAFFAGFDFATAVANTAGIRPDARFGLANTFLERREIRFSAKLTF
jgi:hypothetical protein